MTGLQSQPFTVIDVPQRSPEWYSARVGRLTSSCANDMLATRKDKTEAAGRANLRVRLALERITGKPQDGDYVSKAMQQGIDREVDACGLYEALTGRVLQTVGFLRHDTLMAGASLDGYVGEFEGIVEVKCPIPATHLEYLITGRVPTDYYRQVIHQLWISGAAWCDWLSFNPDFPEPLQTKIVRIQRHGPDIAGYDQQARAFLEEVDRKVELIQTLSGVDAQLRKAGAVA